MLYASSLDQRYEVRPAVSDLWFEEGDKRFYLDSSRGNGGANFLQGRECPASCTIWLGALSPAAGGCWGRGAGASWSRGRRRAGWAVLKLELWATGARGVRVAAAAGTASRARHLGLRPGRIGCNPVSILFDHQIKAKLTRKGSSATRRRYGSAVKSLCLLSARLVAAEIGHVRIWSLLWPA